MEAPTITMSAGNGEVLMWYVIIHLTFVVSAVMMGVLDRITSCQHRGHKGEVVSRRQVLAHAFAHLDQASA